MKHGLFRSALVLGLLSCIGPFSIDMYLPAMPEIARSLNADVAGVQMTITAYFLAFGIAQLVYGPWADQAGRKPPLYLGVAIYLLGSIGCFFAGSIGTLIAWRFVQALGAAAVMVVPRAIIRDMHTGHEATRMMAMIMLVISVSPMLAPLAGSAVIALADWRAIFGVLCVAGVISLCMIAFLLPETLRAEDRVPVNAGRLFSGAGRLLTDRMFMALTFVGGFGMASFFVFLASASFVYAGEFGLTPTQFSLAFAVNAIGFFGASQMAATLGQRFGARRVVLWATGGFAICALATLGLVSAGIGGLPLLIAGLFLGNACLGLVIPTTMVMALDAHGDIAGLASSLGGTIQMLAGGAVVMLSGPFFDGTAVPMVAAIAACAVAAFALALWVLARPLALEI
jgi:DHA1 family bicyclomycin/chloramphenicol resistance-like MFS transporter